MGMRCKCYSSYTLPAYIWAVLSILAAIIAPFGLYFSNWLEKENNGKWDSLSSFRICINRSRIDTACSSYLTFDRIPSIEWQAVTLLMGLGACFLVLVALTSIFGFCITKLFNAMVVVLTFIFQLLGVILFLVGLILFPAGIRVSEVKAFCGDGAGSYQLGELCSLGWAYILIIIGTAIAAIAAVLSWSTLKFREKDHDSHSFSV